MSAYLAAITRAMAQQRGGGAFSPTDLSGLEGWWDASNAGSISATGSLVDQLNDLSGNGRHFIGTTTTRPDTGTVTQNGLNVLDFDGSEYLSQTAFTLDLNGLAIFGVVWQASGVSGRRVWQSFGSNRHVGMTLNEGNSSGKAGALFGGQAWLLHGTTHQFTDAWHQQTFIRATDSNNFHRVNGSQIGTESRSDPNTPSGSAWIGGDSFAKVVMKFAELFVVDGSDISDTDRNAAEAYLKAKWGTP